MRVPRERFETLLVARGATVQAIVHTCDYAHSCIMCCSNVPLLWVENGGCVGVVWLAGSDELFEVGSFNP